MKKLLVTLAVALLATSVATGSATAVAGKGKSKTYEPPYKNGPSGGDRWNHVERDPETGQMFVGRVFPGFSPVVGCAPEPAAGWAMFRVKHEVDEPISKVTVSYDAALDPYAWITVGARAESGRWLGVEKLQGPSGGSGELTATLFDRPSDGDTVLLEFGLQLGDSCPQVSFAAAEFSSISVR